MIKLRRSIIISKYFFFLSGNQSVFHLFWPFFRILAPILLGYITFGQILEIESNEIPYFNWVFSGVSIWIVLGSAFSNGLLLFSSNMRRRKFQNLSFSNLTVVLSHSIPNIVLSIITLLFSAPYVINNRQFNEILMSIICLTILYCLLVNISIAINIMVGVLSALMRDLRVVSQFLSQYLLFGSPIFYLNQIPDSGVEKIFYNLNPVVPILEIQRNLLFGTPMELNNFQVINLTLLFIISTLVTFRTDRIISRLLWCFNVDNFEGDNEVL